MTQLRAVLVSVDYSDILQYTLPYNRHHFSEVCVVTTHQDVSAHTLALRNGCRFFATDAFTRNGAVFNKWLALEEGLDHFGRWGWLCLMDADVLWPRDLTIFDAMGGVGIVGGDGNERVLTIRSPAGSVHVRRNQLCSPLRRMYETFTDHSHPHDPYELCDPTDLPPLPVVLPFPPENQWGQYPVHRNVAEYAGYTQIFHAEDPHLIPCGNCGHDEQRHQPLREDKVRCSRFSWHDTGWLHAGGADSFFQFRWPPSHKVRTPFEVLHLGPAGKNWCGRSTPYVDGSRHPQAEVRAHRVRELFRGRIGKQGDQRFDHERLK